MTLQEAGDARYKASIELRVANAVTALLTQAVQECLKANVAPPPFLCEMLKDANKQSSEASFRFMEAEGHVQRLSSART